MTDKYLKLVRDFPLLPIESKKAAKAALERYLSLSDFGADPDYYGYMRALAILISEWESKQYPHLQNHEISGPDLLASLIEDHNLVKKDLAAAMHILPTNLSAYLKGTRPLPYSALQYLSQRFNMPVKAFEYSPASKVAHGSFSYAHTDTSDKSYAVREDSEVIIKRSKTKK